jgi:hypothetical protein
MGQEGKYGHERRNTWKLENLKVKFDLLNN